MKKILAIIVILIIIIICLMLKNFSSSYRKEIYSKTKIIKIEDSWTLLEEKESLNKDYVAQVYKEKGVLSISDDKLFVIIRENKTLINRLVYVNNNWEGTYTLEWIDEKTINFNSYNIDISKDCVVVPI